jgi:hypothetical protein
MLLGADGDGSTLSLDFTTGVLDSRLTFTRGTTATFINSQGLVQYANANIIRQSENCGSWSGAQNITPTADAAIAPNGTQTADQLNLLASSYRYQVTSTTYAVGQQYVGSIWMRTVSGTASVGFRIANSVTGTNSAIATCSVTETWQRFTTPAFTLSDSANRVIDIGIDQRSIVSGPNVAANIYVWGLQLQPGTSAGEYLPTTTTENLNVARFDYDPTTLAPRGLLIEAAATNLLCWSESFATSGGTTNWTYNGNSGATVTETNPAGGSSSFQFRENSGSGPLSQTVTTVSTSPYTYSFWVRASVFNSVTTTQIQVGIFTTAFQTVSISKISGPGSVSGTGLCTVSGLSLTEWTKVQVTTTGNIGATSASVMLYAQTASFELDRSLLIWGAQVEAGSGASSYIPTGASQATRVADSCVMTGTNFSSWYGSPSSSSVLYEGTIVQNPDGYRKLVALSSVVSDTTVSNFSLTVAGAVNNRPALNSYINSSNNVDAYVPLAGAVTNGTQFRLAARMESGNHRISKGGQVGTSSYSTAPGYPQGLVALSFGADGSLMTSQWVKQFKYYPFSLTNSQMDAWSA